MRSNLTTRTFAILQALVLVVCLAARATCHAAPPEAGGTVQHTVEHTVEEIGWTVTIPSGWKQMSAQKKAQLTTNGLKALENAVGETIDISSLKELLNLEKNRFNSFLSTIQPFDEATDGPYEEAQKALTEVILGAYEDAGIKLGKVTHGKETIDGLEFLTFEVELKNPKNEGVILLTQKMFSRMINGLDFGMTVSTNNEADRKALMSLVASSKFSKRK